ncbi:hypothetical protein L1887_48265 [Cichorium endivia]|nr:hypothetical protein L1887_48265 [Cichorium endivia]
MIGRADIEGSKSNVAMNAWLPQASYPCDVPPQPNSPPDNVLSARIGLPRQALGPKRGHCPASDSRNKYNNVKSSVGFPLSVPVLSCCSTPGEGPRRSRSQSVPGRHAATRSRRGSSSSSPPTADGFGTGTPRAQPSSQSFSRGYGSFLPTSLAYIVPSTRGCSPWRPDAVMSTTGGVGGTRSSGFSRAAGGAPDTARRAVLFQPAGPYLRLSLPFTWNLSPLRPSKFSFEYLLLPPRSAPTAAPPRLTPKVSAQFGTVTRLPVHPASPVLLTKNGPLGALDSVARLNEAAAPSYLFKNSHPGSSYPEGNFGGNQLLDGSISLSPLYPSQTNDLHVSIAAGLHQSFLWLRPAQA